MAEGEDTSGEPAPELEIPRAAAPPRRRRRRWWIAGAAIVALLLIAWLWRSTRPAKRKPPAPVVNVTTAVASRGDIAVNLDTIGTVTALNTISVASQVTGAIAAVHFEEGQIVKKGTPLVEIDARPFTAALRQAEGTLAHDLQVLAQARMDLNRFRAAWASNAIAKQILDDQEHVVLQLEGTVNADRGLVETAQINLQYTRINSPIDGRVGLRLIDPGNLVTANAVAAPLVIVTQMQPISVVFPVSEGDLDQLFGREGLQITAYDRTRTRALGTGVLKTIDNQIDTTTGTVRARAIFDNAAGKLFPNQFVNTRVLVRTLKDVVAVPSVAIQRDATKAFVYAVDTGHAHVVTVKVGVTDGDRTEVEGLAPGTRVATSSFEKLREGVPVQPEEPARQARPAGGPMR